MTDRRRIGSPEGPRARVLNTAALIAAAALLLGGCGSSVDDPYLVALRADPLASYAPPDTDADVSSEQARKDPSSTTKGQQAKILRSFRADDPAAVAAAIDDAVARAQDAGWRLDSRNEQGATLTRPGPETSTMRLTVATSPSEPTVVSLSMTAG